MSTSKLSIVHRRRQDYRCGAALPLGPKSKKMTDKAAEHHRDTIAKLYYEKYYTSSNLPLTGKGSVVAAICKDLCAHNSTVKDVVLEAKAAYDCGDEYNAARKKYCQVLKMLANVPSAGAGSNN